jgi:hypothetical protein
VRALSRCLVIALLAGPTLPLAAQEPQDSLAERVRRAEEAIEMLRAQLADQAQSKVQSRLRNTVELSGLVLMNVFYNSGRTNNSDVPLHADSVPTAERTGLPSANAGASFRQTQIGLTLSGAHALGAELSGDLQLDFYGGQMQSVGNRTFPLIRIRTASVRLDWARLHLMLGQEKPLIAQRNPVSFASAGIPLFARAGNLWLWLPQVRLAAETPGTLHAGVEAAAIAPMQYKPQGTFFTQPDSAERSRRPWLEGRFYLGWGGEDAESEIGIGGHLGWIATAGDSVLHSRAVAVDFRLALGTHVSLTGAGFAGQLLAGLGGGGVAQDLGTGGVPLRTRGGWAQLDIRPTFAWEFGGGVGMDDPNDDDLSVAPAVPGGPETYTGRLKNVALSAHLIWRPGGGLLLGTEFRRLETTYAAGTLSVNHINAYAGLAF